jgi:hypothetical protein
MKQKTHLTCNGEISLEFLFNSILENFLPVDQTRPG